MDRTIASPIPRPSSLVVKELFEEPFPRIFGNARAMVADADANGFVTVSFRC
jgi:hypothetical protein